MTENDRLEFAELMLGLGESYGETISKARMEIYFAALADLDLERIRQASTVHVRACKFFPRVSELREALDGPPEDRAEIAWNALLQLVRQVGYWGVPPTWTDPVMQRAALELFGGWKLLCERLPGDGPALLGYAKQFKAAYRAYSRLKVRDVPALPSKHEAHTRLLTLRDELLERGLPAPGLPEPRATIKRQLRVVGK